MAPRFMQGQALSAYDIAKRGGFVGTETEFERTTAPRAWIPICSTFIDGSLVYIRIDDWISVAGGGQKPPTNVFLDPSGHYLAPSGSNPERPDGGAGGDGGGEGGGGFDGGGDGGGD